MVYWYKSTLRTKIIALGVGLLEEVFQRHVVLASPVLQALCCCCVVLLVVGCVRCVRLTTSARIWKLNTTGKISLTALRMFHVEFRNTDLQLIVFVQKISSARIRKMQTAYEYYFQFFFFNFSYPRSADRLNSQLAYSFRFL